MKALAKFLLVCSLAALPATAQRGGGGHGGGGSHGGGGFHGGGGGFHGGSGGFRGGGFRGGGFAGSGFRGHGGFGGFGRGGFRGFNRGFYGYNRFSFGLGYYPYSAWPYDSYWPYYDSGFADYGYGYPTPSNDYGYSSAPPVIINQYDSNQYDPAPPPAYQPPPRPRPEVREYPESSPSHPYEKPIYLIAFKNQENIRAAEAYWVEGSTLHYVTLQHEHRQAPLDSVDRSLTYRLNRERHVDFRLPAQ